MGTVPTSSGPELVCVVLWEQRLAPGRALSTVALPRSFPCPFCAVVPQNNGSGSRPPWDVDEVAVMAAKALGDRPQRQVGCLSPVTLSPPAAHPALGLVPLTLTCRCWGQPREGCVEPVPRGAGGSADGLRAGPSPTATAAEVPLGSTGRHLRIPAGG